MGKGSGNCLSSDRTKPAADSKADSKPTVAAPAPSQPAVPVEPTAVPAPAPHQPAPTAESQAPKVADVPKLAEDPKAADAPPDTAGVVAVPTAKRFETLQVHAGQEVDPGTRHTHGLYYG